MSSVRLPQLAKNLLQFLEHRASERVGPATGQIEGEDGYLIGSNLKLERRFRQAAGSRGGRGHGMLLAAIEILRESAIASCRVAFPPSHVYSGERAGVRGQSSRAESQLTNWKRPLARRTCWAVYPKSVIVQARCENKCPEIPGPRPRALAQERGDHGPVFLDFLLRTSETPCLAALKCGALPSKTRLLSVFRSFYACSGTYLHAVKGKQRVQRFAMSVGEQIGISANGLGAEWP